MNEEELQDLIAALKNQDNHSLLMSYAEYEFMVRTYPKDDILDSTYRIHQALREEALMRMTANKRATTHLQ